MTRFKLSLFDIIWIVIIIFKILNVVDSKNIVALNDDLTRYFEHKMIKSVGSGQNIKYKFNDVDVDLDVDLDSMWTAFKKRNKKKYTSYDMEEKRKKIFSNNVQYIIKHRVKYLNREINYQLGINSHADQTDEEFLLTNCNDGDNISYDSIKINISNFSEMVKNNPKIYQNMPQNLDFRNHNIVTSVKNQRDCCSSYAFATVGAVEGIYAKQSGVLTDLSPQQIIDHSCWTFGNHKCTGGSPVRAFGYIISTGLVSERQYPYVAAEPVEKKIPPPIVKISGIKQVESNDTELKLAHYHGPIVGFVNNKLMRFYRSGIFYDQKCSKKTNHVVLIVGYGVQRMYLNNKKVQYWLIKNSWGADWGLNGYMKILRNDHECGIGKISYLPFI